MIVIRIAAGFGNQMFQYPFYLYMKKLYGDKTDVLCDLTWYRYNHEGKSFTLDKVFPNINDPAMPQFVMDEAGFLQIFKASGILPNWFSGRASAIFNKLRRYPNRIIREFTYKKRKPYLLDENDEGFYDTVTHLDPHKDYYITGYFLEEKYYTSVISELLEAYEFPEITGERNQAYVKHIQECNSVSIHVRRGDYLSDLYKDKFISLGREYYEKAVNYIKERIDEPVFFVFSDDPEYVEREFKWLDNMVMVTGNDGMESYRDMQLMSMCKANITANSTFSMWGAILNENKDNIVIYPVKYLNGEDSIVREAENWIRL